MAYEKINLGNQPNDGLGDGLRTGGGKINLMFQEIYYQRFVYIVGGITYRVERTGFDAADLSPLALKDDDRIYGFTSAQKTRYVDAIILDATGINIPTDLDDPTKVLLLIDKQIVS